MVLPCEAGGVAQRGIPLGGERIEVVVQSAHVNAIRDAPLHEAVQRRCKAASTREYSTARTCTQYNMQCTCPMEPEPAGLRRCGVGFYGVGRAIGWLSHFAISSHKTLSCASLAGDFFGFLPLGERQTSSAFSDRSRASSCRMYMIDTAPHARDDMQHDRWHLPTAAALWRSDRSLYAETSESILAAAVRRSSVGRGLAACPGVCSG